MQAQRDAFRTFFEATGGQRWKDKGNWEEYLQGASCFDKLHGVTMTNQGQGPAIDLCVDNNGLSGACIQFPMSKLYILSVCFAQLNSF